MHLRAGPASRSGHQACRDAVEETEILERRQDQEVAAVASAERHAPRPSLAAAIHKPAA